MLKKEKTALFLRVCPFIISFTLLFPVLIILLVRIGVLPQFHQWPGIGMLIFIVVCIVFAIVPAVVAVQYSITIHEVIDTMAEGDIPDKKAPIPKKNIRRLRILSIAIAVENLRTRIKTINLENQILYDTALAIYNFSSLQELLNTMTARLTTYFNADYCLIFLVEDDCLNLVSQFNVLTDNIGKRNFRMGEGLVGWTAQQGKPVLSYNVEEDRRYIMCIPNTKSQLTVPLSAYKKTVGVLVLGSHQSHYFEQKDFALVKAIASEIGLAVNDTRITEELKREKMQVSMLYETSRKIAASVGTEDVSNTGVKTVMDLLNATSCSLMLFDEENQQLYIVASRGLSKESEDLVKLKIGEGIAGRVFQEKYPILVEDAMTHHQFKVFPEQKEGFKSLFCVPLLLEDRCIGTLNVGTNAPFSKNQCELAEAVASQLSVALENAFLYESLEQMATHDKLTGLYNYGYFHEVLKKEMERAKRYNHHLSLALLDIDDFKKINDIYGHNVGNYLIKEVSHIIKKNLRSSDVLARYGGDELVVIMPETHSESAYSVMDRMKETIENHEFEIDCNTRVHQKKGGILLRTKIAKWFNNSDIHTNNDVISQLHITISVGVASISGDDISIKEFFNRVDAALRKAKRDGKNRISIWNEDEFE